MEPWFEELRGGHADAAWDSFIARYRRLIFSAIRHHVTDPDDVMDVFARVCEALRADELARLRRYPHDGRPTARFSTWLVAVVRNQTIDWLRHRDGRRGQHLPDGLSHVQQRIYQHVFLDGASHRDCFHLLTSADGIPLSTHEFASELAATYRLASPALPAPRPGAAPLSLDAIELPAEPAAFDGHGSHHLDLALAALPPADRLAVRLFVVDELPAADVARIVGWPSAKTVYNRVGRALKAVRNRFEADGLRREDL
jgi:RNA polymerase sigma factor (sigma-70 family)